MCEVGEPEGVFRVTGEAVVILDIDGGQRDRTAGTLGVRTGRMNVLCCGQFGTSATGWEWAVVGCTNRAIGGRRNIAFKLVDARHGRGCEASGRLIFAVYMVCSKPQVEQKKVVDSMLPLNSSMYQYLR